MQYIATVDGGGGEASETQCYCSVHLACDGREWLQRYDLPEWVRTSNEAEYVAVIAALEEVKKEQGRRVLIRSDSKLVVMQCQKKWRVKAQNLRRYRDKVLELVSQFDEVLFQWTPRDDIEFVLGH